MTNENTNMGSSKGANMGTNKETNGKMHERNTYKSSGVDVEAGDMVSGMLYHACEETWENRKGCLGDIITPHENFSGIRYVSISNLGSDTVLGLNTDGIGTKVEFAERTGIHDTMAFDLIAMVCDDAVRDGGEPLLVGNILDVGSLRGNVPQIKALARGLVEAAREANVAVINGELAELGGRVSGYGPFNYNWGAFVVWVREQRRLITGDNIKPGDQIVALGESGFRSNGLSLVRRILETEYGPDWGTTEGVDLARKILTPSTIYAGAVMDMIGSYGKEPLVDIHGIAHITGGGIPGKMGRLLKRKGLGASFETLFYPPDIMMEVQEMGNIPDREAYQTWNMGQGMLLVTPDVEGVQKVAGSRGLGARVVGTVISRPEIIILSRARKRDLALRFKI